MEGQTLAAWTKTEMRLRRLVVGNEEVDKQPDDRNGL